jgi:U6 snRNA-associated Sm-like protein LSm7
LEFYSDPSDPYRITDKTRKLGLVVCRGTQLSLISPTDGMEEVENPFLDADEEA